MNDKIKKQNQITNQMEHEQENKATQNIAEQTGYFAKKIKRKYLKVPYSMKCFKVYFVIY